MTRTHGYRRGTRDMFSRKFRNHGMINLSTYMRVYKIGDYVDVKVSWNLTALFNSSLTVILSFIGQRCRSQRYAIQGLPRKDWTRLQRHSTRIGSYRQQASPRKDSPQAHQRPRWTRQALKVPWRILGPRQDQRWETSCCSRRRKTYHLETQTRTAFARSRHPESSKTSFPRSNSIRVRRISWSRQLVKISWRDERNKDRNSLNCGNCCLFNFISAAAVNFFK